MRTPIEAIFEDWQRQQRVILKKYGITRNQFKVLQAVASAKRQHAPNQQFIVKHTGMNKMVVSQTLDSLNKKMLITRIRGVIDTRQYTVRLGIPGRTLLDKVAPELAELEKLFSA
ncbi:MAG TPA: MarR family transcriptional regulator [Candidatus Saccharimonadales bacterium]|jgi:DNA-binding MarR family transcriptional regulator|nr:MarR family transcriptional regulator [Candidatus Saccharimonadales bacterium]